MTAHRTDKGIYIYIAYGQSGVRVYKFVKEGEEQPEDNDWVDIGDPDIVWAKENLPGYYAWGEVFHAAHGNGDGNPYETADADGEITFTYTDAEGKKWTATNNAEYYGIPTYSSKEKYTFDNYRFFDGKVWDDNDNRQNMKGKMYKLTKYQIDFEYNNVDGYDRLEPGDDVATMRLGNGWRMPTKEEWDKFLELAGGGYKELNETGAVFAFQNGAEVTLPYTGAYRINKGTFKNSKEFYYWSSDLVTKKTTNASDSSGMGANIYGCDEGYTTTYWCYEPLAWCFVMEENYSGLGVHVNHYERAWGFKVRPVKDKANIPNLAK